MVSTLGEPQYVSCLRGGGGGEEVGGVGCKGNYGVNIG